MALPCDYAKVKWEMLELPAWKILRKMMRLQQKAIQRAEKYNTKLPCLWSLPCENLEDYPPPPSVVHMLEGYIDYVNCVFRDRIAEVDNVETKMKKKRKKKDKLYKNMRAIIRPFIMYYSAAALLITRAIRKMGVHLKKVRG